MSDDPATGTDNAPAIGIVVSRADHASEHIANHLLERGHWQQHSDDHYIGEPDTATAPFELRYFDDLHLNLEAIADDFHDPEYLVFVSRHSGDTGPLLSAHFTGNLGAAEYGGQDRSLAPACPNAQRQVLHALIDHSPADYDVSLECTHHGPSDPGAPSMFVELGSGEEQWRDPEGAAAVAHAVLELADIEEPTTDRTIVAFGGGHYAPRPTRIVRDTDWACGHIAADWGLDELDQPAEHPDVVEQVFTQSNASHAILDGSHPRLESTIADLGFRVVSETWVRETKGVPLETAETLEDRLCSVDDGLRFGDDAPRCDPDSVTVIDLPGALLDDAMGIDAGAIMAAVRSTSVAYETRENGNRVADRAAFHSTDRYDEFVDAVCTVLSEKYETVEQGDEEIVVHELAFDPEKAASLGVPAGPEFGTLAAGESVTVDGETVHPADVTTERTRRYPW